MTTSLFAFTIEPRPRAPGLGMLDTIVVVVRNVSPGRGQILMECGGQAWTAWWGAMGDRTVERFFVEEDILYIMDCLWRNNDSGGLRLVRDVVEAVREELRKLTAPTAEERVAQLDREMKRHAERFLSPDQSDLNPALVALAEQVLAQRAAAWVSVKDRLPEPTQLCDWLFPRGTAKCEQWILCGEAIVSATVPGLASHWRPAQALPEAA